MSDGLREALKRANFECVGKRGMFLKELDVFEGHVRAWHERDVAALRAEAAEQHQLMDLQHERTAEADRAWQKATGKEGVLPDLGTLVGWLMGRAEGAETEVARLREIARKAVGECPDCKGDGHVWACLRIGGSDMDGENVDPGDWESADCERCAALREIAGEKP
jgi:hypothetical protein